MVEVCLVTRSAPLPLVHYRHCTISKLVKIPESNPAAPPKLVYNPLACSAGSNQRGASGAHCTRQTPDSPPLIVAGRVKTSDFASALNRPDDLFTSWRSAHEHYRRSRRPEQCLDATTTAVIGHESVRRRRAALGSFDLAASTDRWGEC
jgi:hypothetical protein